MAFSCYPGNMKKRCSPLRRKFMQPKSVSAFQYAVECASMRLASNSAITNCKPGSKGSDVLRATVGFGFASRLACGLGRASCTDLPPIGGVKPGEHPACDQHQQ